MPFLFVLLAQKFLFKIFTRVTFILGLLLWSSLAAPGELIDIPSITAERLIRDTHTNEVLSRDLVQLSSEGLRSRQSLPDNHLELLQNFHDDRLWMMDWDRKIMHEVTAEDNLANNDSEAELFVAQQGDQPQSSVLAAEPCIDLNAVEVGLASWRGQPVTVWRCEFADGEPFSELFFNELWSLGVREERIDQTTIELVNIKPTKFISNNFYPPNYFRKTDFRELIFGSPEIGNYSE
jgi:hypothetical protein